MIQEGLTKKSTFSSQSSKDHNSFNSQYFWMLLFAYGSSQHPLQLLFTWQEPIMLGGSSKLWRHYKSFVDLVNFYIFSSDFFSNFKDHNFFNFQHLRLILFVLIIWDALYKFSSRIKVKLCLEGHGIYWNITGHFCNTLFSQCE